MTRHSREDALSEREFVELLEAARETKHPFETRFLVFATARLGLRAGEVAHFRSEWINERERLVEIPSYQACSQGKGGEVCGYCRNRARDYVETHTVTEDEAAEQLREEYDDLDDETIEKMASQRAAEGSPSFEDALEKRWQPKTEAGARAIPYDFSVRLELCLERFAERHDAYPSSKATINRRINRAAEYADLDGKCYPHALRATAASLHAYREVSPYALMAIMGWSDLDTAKTYIRSSEENAAREVRSKHR